ncbi:MAG: flagellar hook-length control protein FliK [Desulfatiglandales bacterium]
MIETIQFVFQILGGPQRVGPLEAEEGGFDGILTEQMALEGPFTEALKEVQRPKVGGKSVLETECAQGKDLGPVRKGSEVEVVSSLYERASLEGLLGREVGPGPLSQDGSYETQNLRPKKIENFLPESSLGGLLAREGRKRSNIPVSSQWPTCFSLGPKAFEDTSPGLFRAGQDAILRKIVLDGIGESILTRDTIVSPYSGTDGKSFALEKQNISLPLTEDTKNISAGNESKIGGSENGDLFYTTDLNHFSSRSTDTLYNKDTNRGKDVTANCNLAKESIENIFSQVNNVKNANYSIPIRLSLGNHLDEVNPNELAVFTFKCDSTIITGEYPVSGLKTFLIQHKSAEFEERSEDKEKGIFEHIVKPDPLIKGEPSGTFVNRLSKITPTEDEYATTSKLSPENMFSPGQHTLSRFPEVNIEVKKEFIWDKGTESRFQEHFSTTKDNGGDYKDDRFELTNIKAEDFLDVDQISGFSDDFKKEIHIRDSITDLKTAHFLKEQNDEVRFFAASPHGVSNSNADTFTRSIYHHSQVSEVIHAIKDIISSNGKPRTVLRVSAQPEEMGVIRVQVSGENRDISVQIVTTREEDLHLLDQSLQELRKGLEGEGYNVQEMFVDLDREKKEGSGRQDVPKGRWMRVGEGVLAQGQGAGELSPYVDETGLSIFA